MCAEQIGRAFGVRAKTFGGSFGTLIEMRGEMNHRIVIGNARGIVRIEDV
jgi:hypothetical protein